MLVAVGFATCVLSGCAWDEESVDQQIHRLVTERSEQVGRETQAPERRVRAGEAPGSAFSKKPATTNPDSGALPFTPAAPERDVAKRLEEYDAASLAGGEGAAPAIELDYTTALATANSSARELLNAQEAYIVSAIGLLIERHRWSPRLSNDTTVRAAGAGDQGDFQHALDVINTLKATQRLPFGGQVEAAWVWNAAEQLRDRATGRYTQSSALVFSGSVPLLRGAGLIAQEDLIQAERSLVYAARTFERFRRSFLVEISNDYFQIVQSEAQIKSLERSLESLKQLADATKARVDAGRVNPFEYNLTLNQVLQTQASLAGQREQYILRVDRFKVRLGLPIDRTVKVLPLDFDIPEPEVTLEEASRIALDYRLDLQNQRDQLDDARRAVRNAKNALLPDLNLSGNLSTPTDPAAREGGVVFQPEDLTYSAALTLSLPLDRRIEALNLRTTVIALERQVREYEQARDDVVVAVRATVRGIELSRFQLRLAEEGVEIARRRLEEQKLKEDLVEPQKIVDSENALLQAENARDQSRTNLRNAVLLYLLTSDQLRVTRDGHLQTLPGMERPGAPGVPPPEESPATAPER